MTKILKWFEATQRLQKNVRHVFKLLKSEYRYWADRGLAEVFSS